MDALRRAVGRLPDPDSWAEDAYVVTLGKGSKQVQIPFRRVNAGSRGEQQLRWLFEGKILVRKAEMDDEAEHQSHETGDGDDEGFLARLFG